MAACRSSSGSSYSFRNGTFGPASVPPSWRWNETPWSKNPGESVEGIIVRPAALYAEQVDHDLQVRRQLQQRHAAPIHVDVQVSPRRREFHVLHVRGGTEPFQDAPRRPYPAGSRSRRR